MAYMVETKGMQVDLSIIVTAHGEGRLSHKTMQSVLAAAKKLDEADIRYQIIVSMDNPTTETSDYYHQYRNDRRFTILSGKYGNVADSRNRAVAVTQGKYVALLDGDDMISDNWYLEAYRLAETKSGLFVLHPNVQLQFGVDEPNELVWVMTDSYSKDKDAAIMVQYNRWVSALFAPRAVFDQVQYKRPVDGYGYEDFCFDTDAVAAGIKHYIVPQTTFFYRRSITGKQVEHITQHTVLPYTPLFDLDYAKTWPIADEAVAANSPDLRTRVKGVAFRTYGHLKSSPRVRRLLDGHLRWARNKLYERRRQVLPDWLIQQWQRINAIENQLWPTPDAVRTISFHPRSFDQDGPEATRVGQHYARLARQFTKKPDYIFFTYDPLGAGGTEKVLVNYIKALKELHPDWHFAVMRRKPDHFPFDVPDGVDFIDFFGETAGMHPWEQEVLFDRLIVQSQAKRLHCFFNGWAKGDYTYQWVRDHRQFLAANGYHVYVSWFMQEFVPPAERGRVMSFADPYLEQIYDCVEMIFTDNQTVIEQTLANNYYDKDKFRVHHQPMDFAKFASPRHIETNRPLRVLWASRLSYQKRPDILRQIAQKLDANKIQIDAYGREQNYQGDYLMGIPAVTYRGEFNGFNSLPLDNYDVFLYTSQVDGMPNVLLEATAAGLPIVASNDGGVSELIADKQTGRLVELENIDGYVEALNDIHDHPDTARHYVKAAQKIVAHDYTWQSFNKAVKHDIK